MPEPPRLRVVPLGGLGEIGMNCMAIEVGGEILVVDCGVTFPKSDLGIDVFHPDFSWLEQRRDRIRGLVVTHGHEDHIGAIPYFAQRFEVPIYGPPYALELAKLRLAEHDFREEDVELITTSPRGRLNVGGFEVEPIRVTHSIADATALVVRTAAGTVVHTGDFKLDDTPGDGETTDEERFREVGDEGVRLLLSDSTNSESHGKSGSEAEAARTLEALAQGFPNRIVVGLFASNAHRLRALAHVAMATGRKLVLLGRSVSTHVRVAGQRGKLAIPSDLIVPPEMAMALPRREVLAIATGTQAERLAALTRIGLRTHQHLALDEGDRVIFSSRIIPGNEPAVSDLIGTLLRQGVEIRTQRTDPGVHVSGHAYRDEQAKMLDLVRPESFVPVHGTLMHLHRHADLARERGVKDVIVIENGEIAEVGEGLGVAKAKERALFGKVPTWNGDEIPAQVLYDREAIARSGVAFVTVLVDAWGKPVGPVAVATRGVVDERADHELVRECGREVVRALRERRYQRERPLDEEIAEVARGALRRKLEARTGKKPITVASIMRVRD